MVGLPKIRLPFGGKKDRDEFEYRKFGDNPETRPVNDDLLGYSDLRPTDPKKMKRRTMSPSERGEWVGGLQGAIAERRAFRRAHARNWKLWDLFDLGRPVDLGYMQGEAIYEKYWKKFHRKSMGTTYRDRIYYKDRVGVTRGPCSHQDLRLAYAAGLIDRDTFVWAGMMDEFVPLACVYGLDSLVVTPMSVGARAVTLGVLNARHSIKQIANKRWGPIKNPPVSEWKLDPYAGAGRDRDEPVKELEENKGKFEEDLAKYEDDIERAGTVEYLEKRASGKSARPEKLDALDHDLDADERSKAEIRTPKERARDLEHKILAPRLAKQLTPEEFEDNLEERIRKDKLEHFLKTVTTKDVVEGRAMPEGVDVISDYNEVLVIDRPERGSQEEKEVWDDIQEKDDADQIVTGPWQEHFEKYQDERDRHAVPEGLRHKPRKGNGNDQWRFNLPKIDPRFKVPLLEAIQKRVVNEVKEAFAPNVQPDEQLCRFPDFPWTNGSGGLPYDGIFDLTRPRGKRLPGAIQDAARRGGVPDRDMAFIESWYINVLHPLDDPDLKSQWYDRFKRLKEERFMEKMLAAPWRDATRPLRWFPQTDWDDPYKDHEFITEQKKGTGRFPYARPQEYQSAPMPLELDRFGRQFAPGLKSLDDLPPDDPTHVPYDGKLDRAPIAEWERPEGYGLFTFPGWRKLSRDMTPHKVENEEEVIAERKKLEKEFKELERKELDVVDQYVEANKHIRKQPGYWEEKRDSMWFRQDSMDELMRSIKWRFNNREKIEKVLSATTKQKMIEKQAQKRERFEALSRATVGARKRKGNEVRRLEIQDEEAEEE